MLQTETRAKETEGKYEKMSEKAKDYKSDNKKLITRLEQSKA